jgi:hypothetical protein
MATTTSAEQATKLLGVDLGDWVRERRAQEKSWHAISRDLFVATKQRVSVTGEWLRQLYGTAEPNGGDERGVA